MQSRDDQGNIVFAKMLKGETEQALKEDLEKAKTEAEAHGAVTHKIGKMPAKGYKFELNGLTYQVKFVDVKHGEMRIKLVGFGEYQK